MGIAVEKEGKQSCCHANHQQKRRGESCRGAGEGASEDSEPLWGRVLHGSGFESDAGVNPCVGHIHEQVHGHQKGAIDQYDASE